MQIGKLRHLITIQSLVPEQDDVTGAITESWTTFARIWADVRPATVRDFVDAGIEQSKVTASIKIRYLAGIKQSMRVVHGAQVFNIEGVLPDPKRGTDYLLLPVSEVASG